VFRGFVICKPDHPNCWDSTPKRRGNRKQFYVSNTKKAGTASEMIPARTQFQLAAVAAAEAGDFQTAAANFAAAIAVSPDAALFEQHAQCLMELGQYDEAVEAAGRATSLAPDWAEAWLTSARALLNAGKLQMAHQACAKSLVSWRLLALPQGGSVL
jgi:tetratricopeptide (TPR) repeat protein